MARPNDIRAAQRQAEQTRTFAFGPLLPPGPFPPHAEAACELRLARCEPARHCAQATRCARTDLDLCDLREARVDGTMLRHAAGAWCPLFIDARGFDIETQFRELA